MYFKCQDVLTAFSLLVHLNIITIVNDAHNHGGILYVIYVMLESQCAQSSLVRRQLSHRHSRRHLKDI